MSKRFRSLIVTGISVLVSSTWVACSSSPTTPSAQPEAATPTAEQPVGEVKADAGTDAVPAASAEQPAVAQQTLPADAAVVPAPGTPTDQAAQTAAPTDPAAQSQVQEQVAQTSQPETPPPADPAPTEAPAAVVAEAQGQPETETAAPVAETPAPTREVASHTEAAEGGLVDYKVQGGQTLMQIAFETYGDLFKWRQIYEANKDRIKNPSSIPAGTVLRLEKPSTAVVISRNGEKYLIKRGDTLGTISTDVYGTRSKWKRIWENNKELIHDPNRIFAGFYLYYMMTDEDRREYEMFKQPQLAPKPLAKKSPGTSDRMPASKK